MLDAATGLIYVGNGQYYDPATGRFLSRGVNPGSTNPYVPWQGDPLGLMLGPLAMLVLVRGKRKGGKIDQFLVLLIVAFAVSMTVSSCKPIGDGGDYPSNPPPTTQPSPTPTDSYPTETGETGSGATGVTPTETLEPPDLCDDFYDGEKVVDYAKRHILDPDEYLNDCANFVSSPVSV